jgi:hypothetical protein
VPEIQRAPLAAAERGAAIVVANLQIGAVRDQRVDHADQAAERRARDGREALAAADVDVEPDVQHQQDRWQCVGRGGFVQLPVILAREFLHQVWLRRQRLRRARGVRVHAGGEKLLLDRAAAEEQVVHRSSAVLGGDQQD